MILPRNPLSPDVMSAMKKKPGCLGYIGDYTASYIGDYNKPL